MQKQKAEPSAQQAAEPGTANTAAADSSVAQQTVDKLTELAALGWSVSEHYTEQIRLSGQTAKAELRLSGRSLTLAAGLIVCLGAGLVLLWCSLLLLLGYLIFQASGSLVVSAAVLLLLQFAVLYWCWRSLNYVLSQVGFNKTWQQLRRLLLKAEGGADADR